MKRCVVFSIKEKRHWNSSNDFKVLENGKVENPSYNNDEFESTFPTVSKLDNVKSVYYYCGILMAVTEDGLVFADLNTRQVNHSNELSICDLRSWKNVDKLFYFTDDEFCVIGLCKDGSIVKTGRTFEEDEEFLQIKAVKDVFTCKYGYALITENGNIHATKDLAWMNEFRNVDYIVEHVLDSSESYKAYSIFFKDGTTSFVWTSPSCARFSIQVDHEPGCVMINDYQWLQVTPNGLKSWTGYINTDCNIYQEFNGEHVLAGPSRWSNPEQKRKLQIYKKPIKIAAPYDKYAKYKNLENERELPWIALYEDGTVKVGGFSFAEYNGVKLSPGIVLSTTAVDIAFEDGELVIYEQ